MAILDDLAGLLVTASVGIEGTDLFKSRAPESPNTLIALLPYGGLGPQRTHSGTERRWPRIQAMTRSMDPEEAYALAEAVRAAFVAFRQQQIGPVVYEVIMPLGEPQPLLRDTQGRTPVVINYEVRWHLG
jgi:hypothetical protein